MKKCLTFLAVIATAVAVQFGTAQRVQAATTAPTLYYDFDNSEGQSAQLVGNPNRYDGRVTEQMGSGLDLWLFERNNSPELQAFFNNGGGTCGGAGYGGCEGAAEPNEHYVASPSGTGMHFEGGTGRSYDPASNGNAGVDAQTDNVTTTSNSIFNYRDVAYVGNTNINADSWNHAPTFSSGGPNGGYLTYSFWLNVQLATNVQDGTRFGSGSSFVIGRGSGGPGHGGEVSLKDADGNGGTLDYRLQVRNDGGPNGIQQTSNVYQNGTWHHFTIEYDLTGATGKATIWADGGNLGGGTKEVFYGLGNAQIKERFLINQVGHPGASFRETGDFYIDELAVYSGVNLADSDAAAIYQLGVLGATVPEPSSFVLAGLGLLGLAFAGWRKRRSS